MSAVEEQPAWVLHRRPFRESSIRVELFTQEHGRIGAIAHGSRRRGWNGLLEPFLPLRVSWSGRGDLKTVTGVEQTARGYRLQGRALACGFYMAELVLRLTRREDPHPRSWARYAAAVDDIAGDDPEPALRRFELTLLEECGLGLELAVDAEGRAIDPARGYRYIPDDGARPDSGMGAGVPVSGVTLRALAHPDEADLGADPVRREARWLMRVVIHHHTGGRPLRSREMLRSWRERPQGGARGGDAYEDPGQA